MTLGPIGPMSEQHAEAEAKRVGERAQLHGEGRTLMHDLLNAAFLVRRLARRLTRMVSRR